MAPETEGSTSSSFRVSYRFCTGRALVTPMGWLWTGWAATCTGVTRAEIPSRCPSSTGPTGQCWSARACASPGLSWWMYRTGEWRQESGWEPWKTPKPGQPAGLPVGTVSRLLGFTAPHLPGTSTGQTGVTTR